jgi:hypothetical protein
MVEDIKAAWKNISATLAACEAVDGPHAAGDDEADDYHAREEAGNGLSIIA